MNPINRVTELKIKKTKLATIVTAISGKLSVPVEAQLLAVNGWSNAAARVIVHSAYKMPVMPNNGIRMASTKQENPAVADILRAYVVQIPGDEIFAIAAPNISFNPDQLKLFTHVEKEKMERAWACYASTGGSKTPSVFVMSAPVLPHILRDIPNTISFADESWSVWMDNWLSKFMLKHRYFDGNQFNLVSPLTVPAETVDVVSVNLENYKIEPDVLPPEVVAEVTKPVPAPAKKRGRPSSKLPIA